MRDGSVPWADKPDEERDRGRRTSGACPLWVFLVTLAVAEIVGLAYRRLTAPWVRRVPEFAVVPGIALPTHYLQFASGVVLVVLVMLGYALICRHLADKRED